MPDHDFVHLHVHTEYSLLDGLSQIDVLVERAKSLGMPALAITDHGAMFGVIDFFRACQSAGVKPIVGMEAYLARRSRFDKDPRLDKKPYHLLLLAKNYTGYLNLLQLASRAQLEGYYYRPRVDWQLLETYRDGLVVTSGCLAAEIPAMVADGRDDEARKLIGKYHEVFGADNFFLELQQHDIPELAALNRWLVDYRSSGHSPVQLVATNDVHYVLPEDYDPHDTLLCIQTGALKTDADRLKMTDPSYHLTTQDEMWGYFGEVPEALHNTLKIAEMCNLDLTTKGYRLPVFPVPHGYNAESFLRALAEKGMRWRYGTQLDDSAQRPVLLERLNRELTIIHNLGFDTYFLIVWDLCEFARHADIWWNVRGSGAGSMVAYSLGITNIDPIENNLLFERFLNPGRVSMPDIDLDYPDDRRGEMITYAARKYGEDKVAAIITFGTMGPKAAVRDVGRALNVPLDLVNKAARLIPQEAKPRPLMEYVDADPELKALYENDGNIQKIVNTAVKLQGVNRHASIHAAGVIIGDKPLVQYVPLHRMTNKSEDGRDTGEDTVALKAVTQFPMETCESIGLLKVDFLGLSTLTIMRKACDLIARNHGVVYTLDNIPYREEHHRGDTVTLKMLRETFEWLQEGRTVGVFQLESSGMRQTLREVRPYHFEHIVAVVSLYRPGPLEFIPQFARRMHKQEEVPYHHKSLIPILETTYSIIVYQEQIMQIASQLFGYEPGEADLMRRAVSKKKEKDLLKHKSVFIERGPLVDPTMTPEIAEKIFAEIEFFANYGFNRAHAADYAKITVQSAFLKRHYTAEYMTALLCVQSDDSTKVATFLSECRELGIPILPPDVNRSALEFDIETQPDGTRAIRFGLSAIKNAGATALQPIIDARVQGGGFASVQNFCQRIDLRAVGKRTLESLAKVGAMDAFGSRPQLIEALDRLMRYSADHHDALKVGQMSLFGGAAQVDELTLPTPRDISRRELLQWEKELLGLYVTGRPADRFADALRAAGTWDVQELKENAAAQHERSATIAGEVASVRKLQTKNGDMMGIVQIEDWHETAGVIEVVFFPKSWQKFSSLLEVGEVVMINGKVDASRGDPQIKADSVQKNIQYVTPTAAPLYQSGDDLPAWAVDDGPPPRDYDREMPPPFAAVPDYDEETGEVSTPPELPDAEPPQPVLPATQGGASARTPALVVPFGVPRAGSPWEKEDDGQEDAQYWVVVYLARSGVDQQDRNCLSKVHSLLSIQNRGSDRFSMVFESDGKPVRLDFARYGTTFSDDLVSDLLKVSGVREIAVWNRHREVHSYLPDSGA